MSATQCSGRAQSVASCERGWSSVASDLSGFLHKQYRTSFRARTQKTTKTNSSAHSLQCSHAPLRDISTMLQGAYHAGLPLRHSIKSIDSCVLQGEVSSQERVSTQGSRNICTHMHPPCQLLEYDSKHSHSATVRSPTPLASTRRSRHLCMQYLYVRWPNESTFMRVERRSEHGGNEIHA